MAKADTLDQFGSGEILWKDRKRILGMPISLGELGLDEDNIEDAIAEMIPTLRENKGEPFGSFKKLTMEDAAEIYRLAL